MPGLMAARSRIDGHRAPFGWECVRPWCDLVVRSTKAEEAQAVKALQTRKFSASEVTPSLLAIQHKQPKIAMCRSFRAL